IPNTLSVHKICTRSRLIEPVKALGDLERATCNISKMTGIEEPIRPIASHVLEIIRTVASDPSREENWAKDPQLTQALEALSTALNKNNQPVEFRNTKNTELSRGLRDLANPNRENAKKENGSNPEFLAQKLDHLLDLTITGKKINACYAKATNDFISGSKIVEQNGPGAKFDGVADPGHPGKYVKTLYIHKDSTDSLVAYAHEKRHGCNALVAVPAEEAAKSGNPEAKLARDPVPSFREIKTKNATFGETSASKTSLFCIVSLKQCPTSRHQFFRRKKSKLREWTSSSFESRMRALASVIHLTMMDFSFKTSCLDRVPCIFMDTLS
ncbi:MAG TPA: hypothetical protein VN132_10030, partial [Bdellovibrio sp.]|nr:hypothetical protein [Bdellovibrio sp.]